MFETIKDFITKENSKNKAKERLQIILIQDRINLKGESLNQMKKDIFEVISNYIDIEENLEINLNNNNSSQVALIANMNIKS